jgi:hypothetical protein
MLFLLKFEVKLLIQNVMKKYVLLLLLLAILNSGNLFSQVPDKIYFEYDVAGNQVVRYTCANCINSNQESKEFADLIEEDLIKSFSGDLISYYPNPVKEELYVKWEIIANNLVKEIALYDFNSRLIFKKDKLKDINNCVLNFSTYPKGVYLAVLTYNNGDIKTIKIAKE